MRHLYDFALMRDLRGVGGGKGEGAGAEPLPPPPLLLLDWPGGGSQGEGRAPPLHGGMGHCPHYLCI